MTLTTIIFLLLINIAAIGFLFMFISHKLSIQLETSNKILRSFVEKDPVHITVNTPPQTIIGPSQQHAMQKEDDLKVSIDPNEFLKIMGNVK